jgi:4-amino-4-deoxy-L-arabinose transferase-like glycosyltransferase
LEVVRNFGEFALRDRRPGEAIYAVFPPVQYVLQEVTFWIGSRALNRSVHRHLGRVPPTDGAFDGYQYARWGSILLGLATIYLFAKSASYWTERKSAPLLAGLVVAMHPQFAFVGATVNADAMTIAAGALLVCSLSYWACSGEGARGLTGIGAAAGLILLSKPYLWFCVIPTAFWIGSALRRGSLPVRALGRAVAAGAAVSLPFIAWNVHRLGGDALGLAHFEEFMLHEWSGDPGRVLPHAGRRFLNSLATSAIGNFANLNVPLPTVCIGLAWLMIGIGAAVALRRAWLADVRYRRLALWLIACVVINLSMVAYESWFVDFQPQGRYILLNVLMLACVACLGAVPGAKAVAWQCCCLVIWLLCDALMLRAVLSHPCGP